MPDTEPIFKVDNGVVKLFPFEKHYIVHALEHDIEAVEKQKADTKAHVEEARKTGQNLELCDMTERALSILDHLLRDLKSVLERVNATPTC